MNEKRYVEDNLKNIISDLGKLISYKSVYSDDLKPFGSENRKVLDEALKMFESAGMKTKNLDYYAGFGEIGSGAKTIGIIAHLDVVPAGDNWSSDPFELIEKDGVLYGRGVTDDKGAVISSLYALKYLIDSGYKFKNKVRLIVGCNEETGSKCLAHYVEKEGHIDAGFTPDAHWPGIYGEKGLFHGACSLKSEKILDIKGGEASNAVCNKVEITVTNDFDLNAFKEYLTSNGLKYKIENFEDNLKVKVEGVAAHASLPDLGKNAISYALEGLYQAGLKDIFVEYYHNNIGVGVHGEKANIYLKDKYGDLSFNVGIIKKENDLIKFTIDIRFPITYKVADVTKLMNERFNKNNELSINFVHEPLFIDPKLPMVKALKKAYEDVTGDDKTEMMVIGGGTYAKGINNCIAFGPEYEGVDNHIHDVNEQLIIDELKQNIIIYIQAIKNLDEIEL